MSIENRIETLTVALVELTETVQHLQQQMAHGQELQQQATTPAPEEKAQPEKPVKKAAKKEAPQEKPANAEPETEQPTGITHDQLQSECIKKVRETGGDWFKYKLQDVLKEHGVKTISQLPQEALDPVYAVLLKESK